MADGLEDDPLGILGDKKVAKAAPPVEPTADDDPLGILKPVKKKASSGVSENGSQTSGQPSQTSPTIPGFEVTIGQKNVFNSPTPDLRNQGGFLQSIGDNINNRRYSPVKEAESKRLQEIAGIYKKAQPEIKAEEFAAFGSRKPDVIEAGDVGRDQFTRIADTMGLGTVIGGLSEAIYKPLGGLNRILNDGSAYVYEGLTGKKYDMGDRRGVFGWLADDADRTAARSATIRREDPGATIAGDVYHGTVQTIPLIIGTMMTGGESVAVQAPQIISPLTKFLAGTGALKGYDAARTEGDGIKESLREGVAGGFHGAAEGLAIEAQMMFGRAVGTKAANELAKRGLFYGGEMGAKLLEAAGVGAAFSGTSIGRNILNDEDINWREGATQFGMGLAFEIPAVAGAAGKEIRAERDRLKYDEAIIKNIADKTTENKLTSFLKVTPEQVDGIMKLDKSADELMADALEIGVKAGDATNLAEKRNGYFAQVGLTNAAHIKEVVSDIATDPSNLIRSVQESGLQPAEKDIIIDKVNKIYETYNPEARMRSEIRQKAEVVQQKADDLKQRIAQGISGEQVYTENQRQVDDAVKEFQRKFPEREVDPFDDLPKNVIRTFDRVESDTPTDINAINEASDWLYNKYKFLTSMKESDSRTLTIDQINNYQQQLATDITTLENHKTKYFGDGDVKPENGSQNSAENPKIGDDVGYNLNGESFRGTLKEIKANGDYVVQKPDGTDYTTSTLENVVPAEKTEPAIAQPIRVPAANDVVRTVPIEDAKKGSIEVDELPDGNYTARYADGTIENLTPENVKERTGFDPAVNFDNEITARLSASKDPAEVAKLYDDKIRELEDTGSKEGAIAAYRPTTDVEEFARYNDRNNMTDEIRLQYTQVSDAAKAENKLALDTQAQEINDLYFNGKEVVTPGDITEFMVNHPQGADTYTTPSGNAELDQISKKYQELTGTKLRRDVARKQAQKFDLSIEQVNKAYEETLSDQEKVKNFVDSELKVTDDFIEEMNIIDRMNAEFDKYIEDPSQDWNLYYDIFKGKKPLDSEVDTFRKIINGEQEPAPKEVSAQIKTDGNKQEQKVSIPEGLEPGADTGNGERQTDGNAPAVDENITAGSTAETAKSAKPESEPRSVDIEINGKVYETDGTYVADKETDNLLPFTSDENDIARQVIDRFEALKDKPAEAKVEADAPKELSLAERIRSLKSDRNTLNGGFQGVAVAVWDGALESIATAVEAGANLYDAMRAAAKYVMKNSSAKDENQVARQIYSEVLGLRDNVLDRIKSYTPEQLTQLPESDLLAMHDSYKELNSLGRSSLNKTQDQSFQNIQIELNRREQESIIGPDAQGVIDGLDALKDKSRVVISPRDQKATREVAEKFLDAENMSDAEVEKSFKDALLRSSKADLSSKAPVNTTVEIRLSIRELENRGYGKDEIRRIAENEFKKFNYKDEIAADKIAQHLEPALVDPVPVENNNALAVNKITDTGREVDFVDENGKVSKINTDQVELVPFKIDSFEEKDGMHSFSIEANGTILGNMVLDNDGKYLKVGVADVLDGPDGYLNTQKGIGSRAYEIASKYANENGKLLRSDNADMRSEDANAFWQSLVNKGIAEKVIDGNNDYYVYKNPASEINKLDKSKDPEVKEITLSQRIRALKTDRSNLYGGFQGVATSVWDGALETLATAVDAGVAIKDAIKQAVEYVKANSEAKDDQGIESSLRDDLSILGIDVEVPEPPARNEGESIPAYGARLAEWNRQNMPNINTNNGNLNGSNNAAQGNVFGNNWVLPEESFKEKAERKTIDFLNRLKKAEVSIENAGNIIPSDESAHTQFQLMGSKTAAKVESVMEKVVDGNVKSQKPLFKKVKEAGISVQELGLFMYVQFAPDRNEYVANLRQSSFDAELNRLNVERARKVAAKEATTGIDNKIKLLTSGKNPDFQLLPDGGSGMTNAQAEIFMKEFEKDKKIPNLEKFAEEYRQTVTREDLEMQHDSGMISDTEYQAMSKFKNYIPLQVESKIQDSFTSSVKNVLSNRKTANKTIGSAIQTYDKRVNPAIYGLIQYEKSAVSAAKNNWGTTLKNLVIKNPNPDVWEIEKPRYLPEFDKSGNMTGMREVTPKEIIDQSLKAFDNGKPYYIHLKDDILRRAIKQEGVVKGIGVLNRVNSWYRGVYTTFNPNFILENFIRDPQEAALMLSGEKKGIKTKFVKNIPGALKGIVAHKRGDRTSGWAKTYEEYRESGAEISFAEYDTDIEKLDKVSQSLERIGEKGTSVTKAIRAIGDGMQAASSVLELTTRLAAFKAAKDSGFDVSKAAQMSRNVTVDFNKKGEWTGLTNSLYLFANAGTQGGFNMLKKVLTSSSGRKVMGGYVAAGFAMGMINSLMGQEGNDKDDYYKQPEYMRSSSFMLKNPSGEGFFKFPIGRALAAPFYFGSEMYGVMSGRVKPWEATKNVTLATINSHNPLGSTNDILQLVSPTVTDPLVQMSENKNNFGAPIYKEQKFGAKKPDSQVHFKNTNELSVAFADWLNNTTGGTKVESGALDISPDKVDWTVQQAAGGTGKFIKDNIIGFTMDMTEKDWDGVVKNAPILSRFYTSGKPVSSASQVFKVLEESGNALLDKDVQQSYVNNIKEAIKDKEITPKDAKRYLQEFKKNQARIELSRKHPDWDDKKLNRFFRKD